MVDEVIDMITVALRKICKDHPFYGPAIMQIRYIEDDSIDTGAMSANLEYTFNREYVKKLYEQYKPKGTGMTGADKENVVGQELCGHILHEIMHYIFDHHTRIKHSPRQDVNFIVHNIAADLEINQYIEYPHRTPQMPNNYKTKDGRPFPEYRTYEEYLELLIQSAHSSCKECPNRPTDEKGNPVQQPFDPNQFPQCQNCVPLGIPIGSDGMDINMKGYKEGKTTTAVQKLRGECESAAAQAQGKGSNPSDALKKVEKIVYNWEDVFKAVLHTKSSQMQYGFEHRTFKKPNRRLQGLIKNIIYPARVDYVTELNLVIGMDVSGSMCGLTEKMYGIMKSIADSDELEVKVTILECDTAVCRVIHDFDVGQSEVLTTEGGGTDMGAISVYVQEHHMDPDLLVIMTDNYTDWNPVLFEDKTVVLTNNTMDTCPYKQFEVVFPAE